MVGIGGLTLAMTAALVGVPVTANAAPKPHKAKVQAEKSVAAGPKAKIKSLPANPIAAARVTKAPSVAWPGRRRPPARSRSTRQGPGRAPSTTRRP